MLRSITGLPLSGRIPGLPEQDPPEAALLENDEFAVEDISVDVRNVIGSGVKGLVIANEEWVVKLEYMPVLNMTELDLVKVASDTGIGPKLYSWGSVFVEADQLRRLAQYAERAALELPRWLQSWLRTESEEPVADIIFTITERWEDSLQNFMKQYGASVAAFARIPSSVMIRFSNKIEQLHNMGVVHADIVLRNILVRTDGRGTVTDLCLTDFGLSFYRNDWFLKMKSAGRNALINYYVEEPWMMRIKDKFPTKPDERLRSAAGRWLLYEPFHFDWLVVIMYEKMVLKDNSVLDAPAYFNFDLSWDKVGMFAVQIVVVTGSQQVRYPTLVHAFESLAALRVRMSRQVELQDHLFQRSSDYVVDQNAETELYVSAMIDPVEREIVMIMS